MAGACGATSRADIGPARPAPSAPELYSARLPGAFRWTYRLTRGALSATGSLRWAMQGDRYELVLQGEAPVFGTIIVQRSSGLWGPHGLVPTQFSDRRWRRSERVARFDSAAGWVTFSDGSEPVRWVPGMQDRLSWLVQLAGIAQASRGRVEAGRTLTMQVVGARGDTDRWSFRSEGPTTVEVEGGSVRAMKLARLPREPGDTAVDVWLDPARQHLPVQARMADGQGEPLELSLRRTN